MQKSAKETAAAPLGVMILGRKRPGFDQEWNQIICGRAVAALKSLGYTTVGADKPVVDDATIKVALDKLTRGRMPGAGHAAALDGSRPTGAHGCAAMARSRGAVGYARTSGRWKSQFVLTGRAASLGLHRCARRAMPSSWSMAILTTRCCAQSWCVRLRIARTVAVLRQAKVGVIGTLRSRLHRSRGRSVSCSAGRLGIQLHPLSLPQFIERVHAVPEDAVKKDVQRVLDLKLPMRDVTADDLPMNSRCYLAMQESDRRRESGRDYDSMLARAAEHDRPMAVPGRDPARHRGLPGVDRRRCGWRHR